MINYSIFYRYSKRNLRRHHSVSHRIHVIHIMGNTCDCVTYLFEPGPDQKPLLEKKTNYASSNKEASKNRSVSDRGGEIDKGRPKYSPRFFPASK